jgi:hypothetical protein
MNSAPVLAVAAGALVGLVVLSMRSQVPVADEAAVERVLLPSTPPPGERASELTAEHLVESARAQGEKEASDAPMEDVPVRSGFAKVPLATRLERKYQGLNDGALRRAHHEVARAAAVMERLIVDQLVEEGLYEPYDRTSRLADVQYARLSNKDGAFQIPIYREGRAEYYALRDESLWLLERTR